MKGIGISTGVPHVVLSALATVLGLHAIAHGHAYSAVTLGICAAFGLAGGIVRAKGL